MDMKSIKESFKKMWDIINTNIQINAIENEKYQEILSIKKKYLAKLSDNELSKIYEWYKDTFEMEFEYPLW